MDGAGDDVVGWLADGVAAGVLGVAVGLCLLLLGEPQSGVIAAAGLGLLGLAVLRQVKPEPRRFRLPAIEVPPLDVQAPEAVLDLAPEAEPEALLLDDSLEVVSADSRVVQLFAPRALPTPGELQQRIQAHLSTARPKPETGTVLELEVDAAAALRQALGDLRRNLA